MSKFGTQNADVIGTPDGQSATYSKTEFGLLADGKASVHCRVYDNLIEAEAGSPTEIATITTGPGGSWQYVNDALTVVWLRTADGEVKEVPAPGLAYGRNGNGNWTDKN